MNRIIIGLVGPIASGKGTVIKYLLEKGFSSYSTSDRIREEIRTRGQEVTRNSLTQVSNELRQNFGNEILAKRTADLIEKSHSNNIVIDSIRNPSEINFLKQKYGIKIIAVTADQKKRYELFIKRVENSQPMSFKEFKQLDDKELGGTLGQHTQRVSDCMQMADFVIENNRTLEDLKTKVEEVLSKIKQPANSLEI